MLRNLRGLWLTVGWAMVAAIVWLSLTPSPPTLDFEQSDKLGHFGSYAILMFWFSQLYGKSTRICYVLGFIALGVTLEFAQNLVGFRTLEVLDMSADALGVLLGWAAGSFWRIPAISGAP